MTLLFAPHPPSPPLCSRKRRTSPFGRIQGAAAQNNVKDTPPPLLPHLANRLQNPCRPVPRLHYSATPASLSHSLRSPFTQRTLKVNPPDAGALPFSSSRETPEIYRIFFFTFYFLLAKPETLSSRVKRTRNTHFVFQSSISRSTSLKNKTKMEHTCPGCDVWSVAMTMHPIISPTTS